MEANAHINYYRAQSMKSLLLETRGGRGRKVYGEPESNSDVYIAGNGKFW